MNSTDEFSVGVKVGPHLGWIESLINDDTITQPSVYPATTFYTTPPTQPTVYPVTPFYTTAPPPVTGGSRKMNSLKMIPLLLLLNIGTYFLISIYAG